MKTWWTFFGCLIFLFLPKGEAENFLEGVEAQVVEEEVVEDAAFGAMITPGEGGTGLELGKAFPLDEGSFSAWVRPVNWDGQEEDFVHLASAKTETAWWSIYKYKKDQNQLGLIFLYGRPSEGGRNASFTLAHKLIEDWQKNEWHHVAVTWSVKDRQIILYLDGREAASAGIKDHQVPEGAFSSIRLSPGNRKADGEIFRTVFAELFLQEGVLTPDAIEELAAKKQTAAMKLKNVPSSAATIPFVSTPPVIDGVLSSGEWDHATVLFGGIRAIIPEVNPEQIFRTYICYDAKNIYLMMVSAAPGMQLRSETKENGNMGIYKDDAIEIFFAPDNDPVNCFQYVANSQGFYASRQAKNDQWKADWEYKTTLYEGFWYAELRVPIANIFNGEVKPGMRWLGNFVRNWRTVEPDAQTSWSYTPQSFYSHMGELIFGEKKDGYRLSIDDLALQNAVIKGDLQPATGAKEMTKMNISLLQGEDTVVESRQEDIAEDGSVHFEVKLPGGQQSNLLLEALGENGQPLLRQSIPMAVQSATAFQIRTDFEAQKLMISAPGLFASSAVIRVVDADGKEVKKEAISIEENAQEWKHALDGSRIAPGIYTFQIQWLKENGEQVAEHERVYKHIGRPEWLEWDPQLTKVPKPWTDIVYAKNALEVWGRTYQLQNAPFPASVRTQGVLLIPEPVTLDIMLDGEKVKWEATPKWNQKLAWEGVYTLEGKTASASVIAKTHVEFDGLWYVELEMTPVNGKMNVQEVQVNVPLKSGVAERIYAHNHHRKVIQGAFQPEQLGEYLPHIWVGNHDFGLTWFTESNQYWSHQDPEKVIQFLKGTDKDALRVRVVDKAFETDEKIHYLFGVQATPVRDNAWVRRNIRMSPDPYKSIGNPWSMDRTIFDYATHQGITGALPKNFSVLKTELDRWWEKGMNMAYYLAPDIVSPASTEWEVFGTEWKNPYGAYQWGCVNSGSGRFQPWYYDQMVQHAGLRAIYVDCAKAYPCANEHHGCGYRSPDGTAHVTTPVLALRKYLRNLYVSLHESEPIGDIPPALILHMSGGLTSVAHGFSDAVLEGEEINHRMVQTPSYFDLYPPDKWQAIFGHQQGVNVMLLPNYGQVGPKEDQDSEVLNATFLTQALLNDTPLWNVWSNAEYVARHLELVNPWIRNQETEFFPYWEQKLVVPSNSQLAVSVYKNEEDVLIVIGNFTKNDQSGTLQINWKALGLDASRAKLVDLVSGKEMDVQGASVDVPKENFILLNLNR